jgi:type I restriction enzyme, S subunit
MSNTRLGEVAALITKGTTPTTVGGSFKSYGINFVKSESIADSKYLNSAIFEKIDEETDRKLKRSRLKADDLLFSIAGAYLGKVAIVRDSDVPANTNQAVGIVRLKDDIVDKDYAYYFYSQKSITTYINTLSSQSSQPNLNLDLLGKLPFDQKPLADQKKVAGVLSALDAKINCNNRINAELEAMAKTLYDYWFVQFDFPDANGKPYKSSGGKMVYNATLKREIPAGWRATTLASITPISNDSLNPADFPEKKFRHFSIPVFDATKTYGLELGRSIGSNKFTVLGTDLLVSKLNPWFSRVIYAMDEVDQICSTELVVWRCPTNALKNFLYLIATSPQFIAHCVQSATGTSNSHKRVNPAVMMRFDLPYQNKVAEKFGQKIASILEKLINNQQENQQLAQLRDWLLPLLMNGQVTVA